MLGEPGEPPGEVLAAAIEALQPVRDIDGERLIVLPRRGVGLMPDLAEPPEPGEPGHLAEDDHQQREDHHGEERDGRPADPVVAGDKRDGPVIEPKRSDQADQPAERAEQDAAPAQPAAEIGHGARPRRRQRSRLAVERRR